MLFLIFSVALRVLRGESLFCLAFDLKTKDKRYLTTERCATRRARRKAGVKSREVVSYVSCCLTGCNIMSNLSNGTQLISEVTDRHTVYISLYSHQQDNPNVAVVLIPLISTTLADTCIRDDVPVYISAYVFSLCIR